MNILQILPGNRAMIDTTGLYRVVVQPENDVLDDFVDERRATSLVAMWNQENPGTYAEAIPYASLATGGAA